jgi:uncharacterized membrane protein
MGRPAVFTWLTPALLVGIGIVSFALPYLFKGEHFSKLLLKIYPCLSDLVYVVMIGVSLFAPPSLIHTIATVFDRNLEGRVGKDVLGNYCWYAGLIWCVYFIVDAAIIFVLAVWGTDFMWGLFTSCISYILMGLIIVGEVAGIKIVEKRLARNGAPRSEGGQIEHC